MITKVKNAIAETQKKLKDSIIDLLKSEKSNHSIAFGFALGTFIAILPTYGLHIIIGAIVAFLYKKVNKISMFVSLLFWNPVVVFPVHLLSFKIGKAIFGTTVFVERFNIVVLNQIYDFSKRFLIGVFICAIVFSILSYLLVRLGLYIYKKKRNKDTEAYADGLNKELREGKVVQVNLDTLKKENELHAEKQKEIHAVHLSSMQSEVIHHEPHHDTQHHTESHHVIHELHQEGHNNIDSHHISHEHQPETHQKTHEENKTK
ncbi:MAG: DUF2062 domain-containing protein [Candidatus Woesearchaeota archaeon]|jgi:hypothetical protein